jgi:hypothetical protein
MASPVASSMTCSNCLYSSLSGRPVARIISVTGSRSRRTVCPLRVFFITLKKGLNDPCNKIRRFRFYRFPLCQ